MDALLAPSLSKTTLKEAALSTLQTLALSTMSDSPSFQDRPLKIKKVSPQKKSKNKKWL